MPQLSIDNGEFGENLPLMQICNQKYIYSNWR